ncbi:ATP-binding cassette domain-containing protein [bacterium]|nr:ATP-binding cassette domain-containing protein [candidate division CSSED10-310 bacterium]
MIKVTGLTKEFGLVKALDAISFNVRNGEILGFLGPNGAGKTTTMRILTGFLSPTAGSIEIAGIDLLINPLEARKKIGYLPESIPLYKDLHVDQYLQYVAALKNVPRKNRKTQIDDVIEKCGLMDVRKRIMNKLSKGYRQRVGLAQALIGNPDILILDEPTEGLDPKQIIDIRQLIQELQGNRTVILSSHILPEVSMLCERVLILNKGKVVAEDTPQNLNHGLQNQSIITMLVKGPAQQIIEALESLSDTINIECRTVSESSETHILKLSTPGNIDVRSIAARTIVNKGWELLELKSEVMSLEDIFIHIVSQENVEEVTKCE